MAQKVRTVMIIELLGRPKDHAKQALIDYVAKLDDVKYVDVLKKEFREPKQVDEKNDMYACFCEIEFECENLEQVSMVAFDFMPSSIEILEPASLTLESYEATSIINHMTGRLHRYDDVAKIMQNREKKMHQEAQLARKLLLEHGLIEKDGQVKPEALAKLKDASTRGSSEDSSESRGTSEASKEQKEASKEAEEANSEEPEEANSEEETSEEKSDDEAKEQKD